MSALDMMEQHVTWRSETSQPILIYLYSISRNQEKFHYHAQERHVYSWYPVIYTSISKLLITKLFMFFLFSEDNEDLC